MVSPDDFRPLLEAAGLRPGSILADGELHRCPVEGKPDGRDGAYIVHADPPASYWLQNFRTGQVESGRPEPGKRLSREEEARLRARIQVDREKRRQAQEDRHAAAAERARAELAQAGPVDPGHSYLVAKGVPALGNLRQAGEILLLPALDEQGQVVSLQRIDADGAKRFMKGGRKRGTFFPIPARGGGKDGPLVIAEGYATAASVHQATGLAVLVAWDAGNLLAVIEAVRGKDACRKVIIAADNDASGVGQAKAEEAARTVGGLVALPPQAGQDFNDLHQAEGLDAVRACIEAAKAPEPGDIEGTTPDGWPEPVCLGETCPPPLDPAVLPESLRRLCADVADALQVPVELALTGALAVIATAVQGKAKIKVKPGYREPLNVYLCCALPPGQRKSGTLELLKSPLVSWEAERREEAREAVRVARSERATMEQVIAAKRKAAASAKNADERKKQSAEIVQLEKELPEVPSLPRLLADDVTSEGMAALMAEQGGRLAIIEAEGGLFETLAGRYSGGVPNLDLPLKAWGQEAVHVDRRGRDAIVMVKPTLTLALCPQPDVIASLGEKRAMRGRGLVGRILFWLPDGLLGRRSETRPVAPEIVSGYRQLVRGLLDLPVPKGADGNDAHDDIGMTPEALSVWRAFNAKVEAALGPGGELADMADWAAKLPGQAARIAGLFHCAEHGPRFLEAHVSGETMLAATTVAALLVEHFKVAAGLMRADPRVECAKKVWAWVEREGVERFTAREALQKVKGSFPTMKDLEPGLETLVEYGLVAPLPRERKSQPYVVNPKARSQAHGVR